MKIRPQPTELDARQPGKVRAQLERLLESPPFRSSRRCSDFLRHVVEETCEGRAGQLKERTLGVAVFERDPNYDTNQDPVVRNTAGQVRKRLAQYYCEPGRESEVRIDLPSGSYVPEIHIPELPPAVIAPVVTEPARSRHRPRIAAASIIALIAAATAVWSAAKGDEVEAFWSPLVKHPGAVVLVVGQGHAYKLAGNLDDVFDKTAPPPASATVPINDILPMFDRFVGLSDVRALVRLAGVFAKLGKPVELHGGRTTSLNDLRGKPVVLVGAFNNSWTLNLTGELRFFFEHDAANNLEIVLDRNRPANRNWSVSTEASGAQIRTDYAIVTRVFNPTTEKAVVVAAGIRGGGTTAAGEFLTNREYLSQALKDAPRGWAGKNVQFVLATKMIGGTPGPPTVLASHYW